MKRYNPAEIEPKWQQTWASTSAYEAIDFSDRPKFVLLTEFPYPSGAGLHIGHAREYTLGDIIARYKRAQGYNVLYPMGFDAFGLPTENFAIKHKIAPQVATEQNIANFLQQFRELGCSFDWSRSFSTTDPEYYKWTQWLFLQFFRAGLAYQDEVAINWCPRCKTGLANEEVVSGQHERCGCAVEKKLLKQWMLRITDYADRLIEGLQTVDYPSRIADQQINWIGKKTGINITYQVSNSQQPAAITVFTTRPDTNFGATFVVLAPEHPLVTELLAGKIKLQSGEIPVEAIKAYVEAAASKTDLERQEEGRQKTGVFTGLKVKNELNGAELPVWISDFVLVGFGTGALVGVPGHDQRDFQFAEAFDLPVIRVVVGKDGDETPITQPQQVQEESGVMVNSGFLDGLGVHAATEKIMDYLEEQGWGERVTNYRLRDWIFSRQHYWGEPIPVIHCPECGTVPVPEADLPVELPVVESYEPTDDGKSPLSQIADWVNVKCPVCGGAAQRETDTMPNWAGSSWYYLRYFDAHNDQAFAERKKLDYWSQSSNAGAVDLYLGGMEHTTLHLLYSRFWHQFFYDQGLVPTPEPYAVRRGQGIILASDGRKMSKSLGNVINPSEVIQSGYGADALRVAIAFIAPFDQTTPWSPEGVAGTYRFLNRIWVLAQEFLAAPDSKLAAENPARTRLIHQTIKKVTADLEALQFNTAVASLMECVNGLYKLGVDRAALETLAQLLAPFAPHLAAELWLQLGHSDLLEEAGWPVYQEKYLAADEVTIVVQVAGKVRARLTVPTEKASDEAYLSSIAQSDEKVKTFLGSTPVKKVIVVPKKLVNLVV